MANCDKNNNRRNSDAGPGRSGQCQCTVCGENVSSMDFCKAQNRNGNSSCAPKPSNGCGPDDSQRNRGSVSGWPSNDNSTDSKRSSKSNTQENWCKCVHFCDNELPKSPLKQNHEKRQCDCAECQRPEHVCDCQLCQTEKQTCKFGSNIISARSMFEQIPTPEAYIQRHTEKLSCDVSPFNNNTQASCSTPKPCTCPAFQEKPSTSTASRSFCKGNVGSVRLDTLRSIAKTELNNCIFHGAADMSSCSTDFGNEEEKRGSKEKESLLIEDTYNPGIIEDSVSGVKDFNAISFGMFFEDGQEIPETLPPQTPMTLIEAFHKRIAIERDHMTDALNCHELNLLTVDSIDLYFSYKPKTELNMALSSLFKAEALYKKECKTSKQSTKKVDLPYDVKINKDDMPLVGGSPITVEVFTGTTRPQSLKAKNESKPKVKAKSRISECKVELK